MKPNVLLISHGFQPSYEKGFANGLADNDVTVELIAADRTVANELVSTITVVNLRGSQDPRRSHIQKAVNMVRYAVVLLRYVWNGRHDVVHLTGLFMTGSRFAGLIEWSAYRLLAKRFFMTVHNLLPHNHHTTLNHWIYRLVYRLPDKLVVHTEKMKTGLCDQFGIDPSRVIVMLHGVDAPPEALRVPAPSEELRILLFGGLSPYKGADLLLEALQCCPDFPIRIVIAGETRDPAYKARIENLIEALPPSHVVQWERRFIEECDVRAYFEAADVVVLPYRHIDQSGVLFTAYRFGTPVIASDVGSFREFLPAYAGMIVPTLTPAAFAETVREFNRRKTGFDRARIRHLAESMVWPITVKPLVDAYRAVTQ